MPVELSFSDVFSYFMSIGPILVASFLVVGSAFNQNAKGFIYLCGLLLSFIIGVGFKNLFRTGRQGVIQDDCSIFQFPPLITTYTLPDLNSLLLTFTAAYLFWPMFKGETPPNAWMIIILLTFIIGNGITRTLKGCNNVMDLIIGIMLGFACGTGWFFLFWLTNNKKLLYLDDLLSNKVVCNRPSKQTFKCAVYKNGELLKHL
jgi:hypothetical protein